MRHYFSSVIFSSNNSRYDHDAVHTYIHTHTHTQTHTHNKESANKFIYQYINNPQQHIYKYIISIN